MRTNQKNRIVMYQAVETVCQMHQASWENNLGFSEAHSDFSSKLNLLITLSDEHLNSTKGATATKRNLKRILIEKAMMLSNVLGAYATKIGNMELHMRSIYIRSEWKRGNILVFLGRLKHVHHDALAFASGLGEFGIAPAAIQEFGDLISDYESVGKKPRYLINDHKTITQKIKSLILEIDQILTEQLDRVLLVFEETAPDFCKTFKNARLIVDLKGKRHKLQHPEVPEAPDSEIPVEASNED